MTEPAPAGAGFPQLDDDQLAIVTTLGERRSVQAGDVLFSPADAAYDWVVLLTASAEILGPGGELIVRHGPRGFLGEVSLVTRQRPYLTARVVEAGDVIVVPAEVFRSRVLSDERLEDGVAQPHIAQHPAAEDLRGDHHDLARLDDDGRQVRPLSGHETDLAEEAPRTMAHDELAARAEDLG